MNQNIPQIQWQTAFIIHPNQTLPYIHMPIAVNQFSNCISYNYQPQLPQLMYPTQLQTYPATQTYPISTFQPIENNRYHHQIDKQVKSLSCDENTIAQKQNLFQQHNSQQISFYNNMQITKTEQYNEILKQKTNQDQSDNTIPINQTQDHKKSQQYDYISFSSESMINNKYMKQEQEAQNLVFKQNVTPQSKQKCNDIDVKLKSKTQNLQQTLITKENLEYNTIQIKKNKDDTDENSCNQLGKITFNLSSNQIDLLKQLQGINIQNAFKNILKGFKSYVNEKFTHIYIYDYQQTEIQSDKEQEESILRQEQDIINVRIIENPTKLEKKSFIQKFNKFIKNKKYNNTSIRQIIENKLYSAVLKDYIMNNSSDWINSSNFQNKEDIIIVLQFFQMCCQNQNLLLFLSKNKDKLIHLSTNE